METDTSDKENDDNPKPPASQHHPPQREPSESLDEPRTGQENPPPLPQPAPAGPQPAQPSRTFPPQPQLPCAGGGTTATSYGGGGGLWPPPQPPRPPGMFSPPRSRQMGPHPITISRPGAPSSSSQPPQRSLQQLPLYPVTPRPVAVPPAYAGAGEIPEEVEDELSPSAPPLHVRRVMPPPGLMPMHPAAAALPPPLRPPPMPSMRLQEGPWRAFAGPRLAARPLRPLRPRAETGPYDTPLLVGEPAPMRVRHNVYASPLPPGPHPPPRAVMPLAAYRTLPRQHSGGLPGHPYAAPPLWIDPRMPPQRPLYGMGRMQPIPQRPKQPLTPFPVAQPPPQPHACARSAGILEAMEETTAAAVAAATAAAAAQTARTVKPIVTVEQSGESPSGGAADAPGNSGGGGSGGGGSGGGGGDGQGNAASPSTAFPYPDHPHVEVTVAIRVPRATSDISGAAATAAVAAAGTGSSGSGGAGAVGTTVRGGPPAVPEDSQPPPAAAPDLRSGYMPGPVRGIFDVPRYLAGRDCIFHNGRWLSRSNFERVGGSKMAKWYRSIRVLPDLEPLGEWLERHGMPVTKGPARRSSKRMALDTGEDPWILGALAGRGVIAGGGGGDGSARGSGDLDDEAIAYPEYESFARVTRIPVRQDRISLAGADPHGDPGQRSLPSAPYMTSPVRPGVMPPMMTSPRQSLAALSRRHSSGITEGGSFYGVPARQTGSTSPRYESSFVSAGVPLSSLPQQPQQQKEPSDAEKASAEAEEDVATLRWLLRQTTRAAAAATSQTTSSVGAAAAAAARQNFPPPPPPFLRKVEGPAVSPPVQMPLRWASAAAEAGAAAATDAAVPGEEPAMLRPTRRQRFTATRTNEYDEALVDVNVVDELLPAPELLAPPPQRRTSGADVAGTSGRVTMASAEPPRRTSLRQPDLLRFGGVMDAGAGPRTSSGFPPRTEPHLVLERPRIYPYFRHAPPLKDVQYYRNSRRVSTMEAPSAAIRTGGGGSGPGAATASTAAGPAVMVGPTGMPMVQSAPVMQRFRYLETPPPAPPPQYPQQAQHPWPVHTRLQVQRNWQTWERKEGVMQGPIGEEDEVMAEAEELQERYRPHRYDLSHAHVTPSLPEQQLQQLQQQELHHQIDQQQRAELEEYALRHRALRRRRQNDESPGGDPYNNEDWERDS